MKIHKISFKNIHSLRGEHHIDFSSGPLAEGGLFAITGATGAGKSTLLDVITLALYNRIPRIEGNISKSVIDGEGGIMTRNAQDCYAEVEYCVNGKTYRSHWSIERNRNNNLNDRKQEIIDVATGAIIESGKSTVPAKNEELIGLKYDQFVKAMVLSQGQFSKLLKAKRDERNKLLEDITGAKDYREIGKAVFVKYRHALKACETETIKLGEIERIPKEERKELVANAILLKESKIARKKALELLKTEIEHQKGISKNNAILTKNKLQAEELLNAQDAFKSEAVKLKLHEKYVIHKPLLQDFEQKEKELLEQSGNLKRQENLGGNIINECTYILEQAKAILKQPVENENLVGQLNAFREKVIVLKEAENLARNEAGVHQKTIQNLLLEINKDAERVSFNPSPKEFILGIAPREQRIDQFLEASDIKNTNSIEVQEEQLKSRLNILQDLKIAFTTYQLELKNKIENEKGLKNSQEAFQVHEKTLKSLESRMKLLQTEVEELTKIEEHRKKHLSLEAHRNLLVDGEACPLCGALEHPYASKNPVFDMQADVLKTKAELLTSQRELKSSTQTNLVNEEKNRQQLQKNIEEQNKKLEPALIEIQKLWNQLQMEGSADKEKIEGLEKKYLEASQKLEQVKKAFHLKTLLQNLKSVAEQWKAVVDQMNEKQTVRKKLYEGDDIADKVQNLITKWTANVENAKNNQQLILELKRKIDIISKAKETFEKQLNLLLHKENIESAEHLNSLILSESEAQTIRKKEVELRLINERLKTERDNALKEIENLKKLVSRDEPLAVLENNFNANEETLNELTKQLVTIDNRLVADHKTQEKEKAILQNLEALKKEEALWKTMNSLIGDANGKRFSNFVQDLTLEQLIGYTNLRLKDLSDRYILDIPTADEADKNDSLKVFDVHQGDARRSINTLSGGETFMVSLAMAFALSDLAAKNVKIESIFIDEGFGTLDPETLNQAITILEKMQNEGDKSIGVISHVEALKERITTQIRLEKLGSGYSTIEII